MNRVSLVLSVSVVVVFSLSAVAWLVREPPPVPAPPSVPAAASEPSQAAAPAEAPAVPVLAPETVRVRPRETLVALLRREGLDVPAAHALVRELKRAGLNPRAIRARDRFEIERDPEGRLMALSYAPSAWQRYEAGRVEGEWRAARVEVTPEIRVEVREGRIERSLWDAVESGAVDAQTILDLVGIFESDFDFAVDTQPGDRFRLLVEARYGDGRFVEVGRILAARYDAGSTAMVGVGFDVDGRLNYYSPAGESLKKTFLRSPLQFTRISSGYTLRRPHPVLGGVRPHLAIDYAAPTGTPVWAVADGTVEFAGRKGGNGIQVLLRHRGGYSTYYNHLSRIARGVRPGARVRQKAVIGYVGSTGLSTGPHLDYRVSVRGRFVNPLSERFLPGDPVPAARRDEFEAHAQRLIAQLDAPAREAEAEAAGSPVPVAGRAARTAAPTTAPAR